MTDAVPSPIRALSTLFSEALPQVVFPDVDAAALAASVAKVDAAQAEVTRLEEELTKARAALETSRDDLVKLAARAHSYARIYAEDDEALRARIDEIVLPRARAKMSTVAQPKPATTPTTVASADAATTTDAPATTSSKRKKKRDDDASLFTDESARAA